MTIATYLRLSSEDDDLKDTGKAESESISNQRGLLRNFIGSVPEFAGAEIIEFCDDGWSGKNFERPGFVDMMEQTKRGRINCIIVKDLSRFGRDYLIVGNYISRVFPFLGVRFIAVNDGFDSARPQDIDSLDTSFKTLIYDLYSRELSRKVKEAKRQRAEKGLFLSPFAPYGYTKDPEDHNHLIIDEVAAVNVRRIFQMAADGHSPVGIAALFNREGVLSPMLYKRESGCSRDRWPSIHEENFWTTSTVSKILRDERYIGKCVFGKRERDMVGNTHTVKISRSDWVIADETHEAVISTELYDAVQARMKCYREYEATVSTRNPLRGKVICGVCGHAMRLSTTKNAKYHCSTVSLETGYGCDSAGILRADIFDAVVTLIRTYAKYAVSLERLASLQNEKRRADMKIAHRELAVLQSRKNQLDKGLQDLYEKLIDGSIGKETYLVQKQTANSQIQELASRISVLESEMKSPEANGSSFIDKYKEYAELETLTGDVAKELVEKVVLYPDGRMEINLLCRDELKAILQEKAALSSAS